MFSRYSVPVIGRQLWLQLVTGSFISLVKFSRFLPPGSALLVNLSCVFYICQSNFPSDIIFSTRNIFFIPCMALPAMDSSQFLHVNTSLSHVHLKKGAFTWYWILVWPFFLSLPSRCCSLFSGFLGFSREVCCLVIILPL